MNTIKMPVYPRSWNQLKKTYVMMLTLTL